MTMPDLAIQTRNAFHQAAELLAVVADGPQPYVTVEPGGLVRIWYAESSAPYSQRKALIARLANTLGVPAEIRDYGDRTSFETSGTWRDFPVSACTPVLMVPVER